MSCTFGAQGLCPEERKQALGGDREVGGVSGEHLRPTSEGDAVGKRAVWAPRSSGAERDRV